MLKLEQISKTYSDGTRALDSIDLEVSAGMVGLLGPNGAGKTTLLSILNLAQEPSGGRRTYGELDDRPANRSAIRCLLGYLPQEFDPIAGLTGFEYLELCGRLRRVPLPRRGLRRRIRALLEAVELQDAAHRRADRYSGGMIRRLGLAQAILHSPKLLVVDEPTAGLDPDERIRFRNLVTDLADEIPVLLSTHIVEDIEATCPRLAIIARGRLLFDGAPGTLMHRVEGKLYEISGESTAGNGVVAIGRRVDADGRATRVVHAETPPTGGRPVAPALEEACSAFLALEGHQRLDDDTTDAGPVAP